MNDLNPQSMHHPLSPYGEQSKQSFGAHNYCFPASPQSEPSSMDRSAQGLGIMVPQQQSNVQDLPPSPQPSDSWSQSPMMEHSEYPQTSQQPPDISSAQYDPFAAYSLNPGMMGTSSPEATPSLVFCQSPPSTSMPSHRGSISSACSPADSYSPQDTDYYTPRVKMEDGREWYASHGNDQILQPRLTTQGLSPYSNGISPISGPAEDQYKSAPAYPTDFSHMNGGSDEPRAPYIVPSFNTAPKRKRQRTTPEEATHECRTCGKLFKRSYNWKSHMETHNPQRKYPHPCTATTNGQPCAKKFQRKTDLDRHFDSVHRKLRNHRCQMCGHSFARRDTLRRHTEDGCTKRFGLDFPHTATPAAAAAAPRWPLNNFTPPPKRSISLGSAMPPPAPTMAPSLSAGPSHAPFPSFDRPFVSSPLQTSAIFAQ